MQKLSNVFTRKVEEVRSSYRGCLVLLFIYLAKHILITCVYKSDG